MLAVSSNKRHRDSPASQPEACSPHRAAMLLESPASKRTRAHGEAATASGGSSSSSAFLQQLDGMQHGAQLPDSPVWPPTIFSRASALAHYPKTCPARYSDLQAAKQAPTDPILPRAPLCLAGAAAVAQLTPEQFQQQQQLGQRIDPVTGEHLFSMEQVRDLVRRAVDEKERTLREQYDRILQQKLQEQYQAFAKFNEDYISRSLKTNDLGYVS